MNHNYINKKLTLSVITVAIMLMSFMLNVSGRFLSALAITFNNDANYYLSEKISYSLMFVYIFFALGAIIIPKYANASQISSTILKALIASSLLSIIGAFYSDMIYLYKSLQLSDNYEAFTPSLMAYSIKEAWFYSAHFFLITIIYILHQYLYKASFLKSFWLKFSITALLIFLPVILIYPLPLMNLLLFSQSSINKFRDIPLPLLFILNSCYTITSIALLIYAYQCRHSYQLSLNWLIKQSNIVAAGIATTLIFYLAITFIGCKIQAGRLYLSASDTILATGSHLKDNAHLFIPIMVLIFTTGIIRQIIKHQQFNNESNVDDTTGSFGTASFATVKDLEKLNAFDSKNGIVIGAIEQ